MTNRTVKVLGWGTGSSLAKIKAVVDGETVFDGTVDLVELSKDNESEQTAPTLFTFDIPLEFVGTKQMTVSVADAAVRFGQMVANFAPVEMGAIFYSSGKDSYMDVAEYDSDYVRDPRTNVAIDGQAQAVDRTFAKGTWHWTVAPGSTLTHDLIVPKAGMSDD